MCISYDTINIRIVLCHNVRLIYYVRLRYYQYDSRIRSTLCNSSCTNYYESQIDDNKTYSEIGQPKKSGPQKEKKMVECI